MNKRSQVRIVELEDLAQDSWEEWAKLILKSLKSVDNSQRYIRP